MAIRLFLSIKNFFQPKLKLVRGTRFVSLLFIALSILIGAGFLLAANIYYDMDIGEVVVEEIQRVTELIKAPGGVVVGGTATTSPVMFEVVSGDVLFSTSGTIEQSGTGQVTFAGNLDATGGVDVTGANFTVGGTNFTVDVNTGNTSIAGTLGVTATSTFSSTIVLENAQEMRFKEPSGDGDEYIGFQAPSNVTTSKVYVLPQHGLYPPSPDYVLSYQSGDELRWIDVTTVAAGDITAVGDVTSGPAFTGGDTGNTLWFEGATEDTYEIALTAADPGADYTITLPAQTGTVGLLAATLNPGGVLFADSAGLITQDTSNLYWDDTNNYLGVGTSSPAYLLDVMGTIRAGSYNTTGTIRIYSGTTQYEVVFQPSSAMTANTVYTLPPDTGTNNYVLTTDGTGVLAWEAVTGAGAVDVLGTPSQGQVSFFYDENTVMGDTGLTYSTTTQKLTITGGLVTNLIEYDGGDLTIQTLTSGDIVLDPVSGIILLGTDDYIQTSDGYEIGKTGHQIARGAVSVFGFDLPMRCQTSCSAGTYATVTRTIENDDEIFPDPYPGTTRIYKFAIRYADATTTVSTTWQVATSSDPTYVDQFTLPPTSSTDLEKGFATTTSAVSLPSADSWFLRVTTGGTGNYELQIYDILLIGLDEIL